MNIPSLKKKINATVCLFVVIAGFLLFACFSFHKEIKAAEYKNLFNIQKLTAVKPDSISKIQAQIKSENKKEISELEQIFIDAGLVRIRDIDSTIKINLKYASHDNFLGINMYGDIKEGYLPSPVARQLAKAEKYLKDTLPEFCLVVFDAARPLSIQKLMWDSIKVEADMKSKYVSNPVYGSLHNYGAAVDLSILDNTGKELDMGTPYDSFEKLAYPVLEKDMLKKGLLTKQQIANRVLLRKVMNKALFSGIPTEWWHFNSCSNKEAKNFYALIKNHTLKKKEHIKLKKVSSVNIAFKVQIKISQKSINPTSLEFKGLEVTSYHHKGLYKYTTGNVKDLASAHEILEKVEKMGFTDAFIVAFNNDTRIEIRDAIELMQ